MLRRCLLRARALRMGEVKRENNFQRNENVVFVLSFFFNIDIFHLNTRSLYSRKSDRTKLSYSLQCRVNLFVEKGYSSRNRIYKL